MESGVKGKHLWRFCYALRAGHNARSADTRACPFTVVSGWTWHMLWWERHVNYRRGSCLDGKDPAQMRICAERRARLAGGCGTIPPRLRTVGVWTRDPVRKGREDNVSNRREERALNFYTPPAGTPTPGKWPEYRRPPVFYSAGPEKVKRDGFESEI